MLHFFVDLVSQVPSNNDERLEFIDKFSWVKEVPVFVAFFFASNFI